MKTIACLLPFLTFAFWCVHVTAQDAADSGQPPQVAPVTTDAEIEADLNLDAPGMEKVKAALATGDLGQVQAAYLDYRRTACPAKWKVMPGDMPPATATDDKTGDEICNHYIRNFFYNFEPKAADMGKDFDWKFNPVPRTDPAFTDQWTYCAISRCQFWEKLADAYWKTRNEKYAVEWVNQLKDFAAKNPAPAGEQGMFYNPPEGPVSLWLALDAGTRMGESWPYAYYHFRDSPSFTPEAQWLYAKMMCDHATRLKTGLGKPGRSGNWISIECRGLYTIGVLFPELKDAAAWRDFAMSRLSEEMNRVVPPDGFESELTPNYHMVTLNCTLGQVQLARLNNLPVPDVLQSKLLSMYRALVLVMDQSGNDVPTNDSGIVSAKAGARAGLKLSADPLLEWAALGGKSGMAPPDSTALPYAGFYAMRSGWQPNDLFLFFRAGPTGTGHEHEDMLEVVLRAWNKTLLFDPGTYPYDSSDMRRFTIGTASHNTIIVDGKWQHRGPNKPPVDKPAGNPWVTTPLFDFVAGTYDGGYQTSVYDQRPYDPQKWVGPVDHSVTHTRRVLFLRPYYALVLDTLDGTGTHTFDAHFHMDAPAAHVDDKTQAAFSDNTTATQLALYPLNRDNLTVDIVQGHEHPLLGWMPSQHRAIPTIRFRKQQEAPATFATFLYPYQGQAPEFGATPLDVTGDGVWSQALSTPREKAEIVLVEDGTAKALSFTSALLGALRVTASGFVIRQPAGSNEIDAGGWGLSSYDDGKTAFTLDAPAAVLFSEQPGKVLFYNAGDKDAALTFTRPFSRTVTLAPSVWTEVSQNVEQPAATRPALFPPLAAKVSRSSRYADLCSISL